MANKHPASLPSPGRPDSPKYSSGDELDKELDKAYKESDKFRQHSPQGYIVDTPRSRLTASEQSKEVRDNLPHGRKPKPNYESPWHEFKFNQSHGTGKTKRKKRRKLKTKRKKHTKKRKHKKRKSSRKK